MFPNFLSSIFVFAFILSCNVQASPQAGGETTEPTLLFGDDKFVQELKTSSDLQSLLQQLATGTNEGQSAVGVFYYATWCPHCHKTAPVWKNLANAFHCTPGIRLYSFECSMTSGDRIGPDGVTPFQTCMNQTVEGFPTMMAYWPKSLDEGRSVANKTLEIASPDFSLAQKVVAALSGSSTKKEKIDELVYNVSEQQHQPGSSTAEGQKGVLLRRPMDVTTRSVSELRQWILDHTPIREVKRCILSTDSDLLGVGIAPIDSLVAASDKVLTMTERWPSQVFAACPDTRLYDSLSGFLYLLKNWVISQEGLTEQKNEDLKQLISSAMTLLPGRNVQASLKNFYDSLKSQSSFTSSDYHALVDRLELAGLKALPIGQTPTLLHTPRLTSSIWLLFHTFTVSLFTQSHVKEAHAALSNFNRTCSGPTHIESRQLAGLDDEDDGQQQQLTSQLREDHPITPWTVAKSIRTTVGSFFACEVCRVHFTTFFDRCYADLCVWVKDTMKPFEVPIVVESQSNNNNNKIYDSTEGLLLWLWRFHNAVTFRTAVERTSNSIVTLQEIAMKKNDKAELLMRNRLVSYQGQDVRFPPSKLCPSCHQTLPTLYKNDNMTIYALPHHRNITSEAFKVSKSLVDKSVNVERMMRGYESSDSNALAALTPLDDSTWDRTEDFNFHKIQDFLIGYLWKPQWIDYSIDLNWDNENGIFITMPHHGSSAEKDNNEKDDDSEKEDDLISRKLLGGVPQVLAAKVAPLHSSIELMKSSHHHQRSIGTAGGLFSFFVLSSLLVFVAYAKMKRGTNSLSYEFFRTMGLRPHLKLKRESPRDMELGDEDDHSVDSNGSSVYGSRVDPYQGRQRYFGR